MCGCRAEKRQAEAYPTLSHLHNFATAGNPQIRVALHLGAEGFIRCVLFHLGFKFRDTLHLIFQNDAVEFTRQIRQNSGTRNLRRSGRFLQLGGELTCVSRFGDETVSHDEHGRTSLETYSATGYTSLFRDLKRYLNRSICGAGFSLWVLALQG